MNHIGEIEELTKIALPNIALITNVSNSHIANFKSEKEIAEAKSEIFLGLKDPSSVILNADNKWCDLLLKKAKKTKAKIHFFGFWPKHTARREPVRPRKVDFFHTLFGN